jgi:hypothetical protein
VNKRINLFLLPLLFALWWGGFTFYAAVVVPQGMAILGDHVKMGLITQSVTFYLNTIGSIVLISSLFFLIVNKRTEINYLQTIGWEWILLVIFQVILFNLHSKLSNMISIELPEINLQEGFYTIHRIYLLISSVIWILIPIHYHRVKNELARI